MAGQEGRGHHPYQALGMGRNWDEWCSMASTSIRQIVAAYLESNTIPK